MAQTQTQRRASDAVAAWLARLHRNPAWLVEETGADPGTIGDFLNGRRWPKIGTQGRIEDAVGWPSGTIRQIGNGGDVPPIPDYAWNVEVEVADQRAGPERDDLAQQVYDLLHRRPDGVSDAEWERIRNESRGFIEWQIDRAAKER